VHTVTPMLAIRGAVEAIEFYRHAFGARETMRLTGPGGSIAHAELAIGDGLIMLAEEDPRFNAVPEVLGGTPVIVHLYVPDVDAVVARAVQAGARVLIPVADQFYGDRAGRIADPYGHVWIVSTRQAEMTPEEMQRRFEALMAGPAPE
jgi:PhnB protein